MSPGQTGSKGGNTLLRTEAPSLTGSASSGSFTSGSSSISVFGLFVSRLMAFPLKFSSRAIDGGGNLGRGVECWEEG
jgi:hypothetical protein